MGCSFRSPGDDAEADDGAVRAVGLRHADADEALLAAVGFSLRGRPKDPNLVHFFLS